MKRLLFLTILSLSHPALSKNEGADRIVGIWEGSSTDSGIFFYDQLVVKADFSGVFITGGVDAMSDEYIGGTFAKGEMVDRGGYYEIVFQDNPNTKLLITYELSSNSLKGWLFITDPETGFTFSPFLKELYKTDGKGRADTINAVSQRVNKLLKGDYSLRGSPSAHSTTQTSAP